MMPLGLRPAKNEIKSGAKIHPVERVRIIAVRLKKRGYINEEDKC